MTAKVDRTWIGRKYGTRERLEHAIEVFVAMGERFADERDALPFESPAYWAAHDACEFWFDKAAELMPRGS